MFSEVMVKSSLWLWLCWRPCSPHSFQTAYVPSQNYTKEDTDSLVDPVRIPRGASYDRHRSTTWCFCSAQLAPCPLLSEESQAMLYLHLVKLSAKKSLHHRYECCSWLSSVRLRLDEIPIMLAIWR